ncbi:hypothetical protein AX16_002679 [Volvariella volvacea WC 439]|nr:hypothetical protein AX16_002679 [Volvariella volvacea WC 439]
MSSCGNPEHEQNAVMTRKPKFDKTKDCVRCKTNAGNIVIRHAVYCKECFGPMVAIKFRKSLEPSVNPTPDGPRRKGLKASGNLFLAFSGGLGSSVLLDLVYRSYFSLAAEFVPRDANGEKRGGKDHPRNKRVWNKATVCYVECCNAHLGVRDRVDEIREVVMRNYPEFEFRALRVEDAFDESWWHSTGGKPLDDAWVVNTTNEDLQVTSSPTSAQSTPATRLKSYLASLPTQTAIPTAINNLIRLLLLHAAWADGSSHLLFGTSLTSLSISLISGIAQGNGFAIREEVQEEWTPPSRSGEAGLSPRHPLRIIRPLRDVGIKECAMWAWWNQVIVPGQENYIGGKQGIGALTQNFIMGLERDFPSTVSTIARTCAKVVPKEQSTSLCILCNRPAQPGVQEWKSRISIRAYDANSLPPHVPSSALSMLDQLHQSNSLLGLTPRLCYACHTMLTSRSSRGIPPSANASHTPMPVWVNEVVMSDAVRLKKMNDSQMRDAIADFLLDGTE